MPITKSAKKALRQSFRRKVRNLSQRRKLRQLLKDVRVLIMEKKSEEAKKNLPSVYKAIDKAAKNGLIKKNTASRIKSRIAKKIKS